MVHIRNIKTNKNAVIPSKSGENEVGYDLTAIEFEKLILDNVYLFNTGIKVEPPQGFYVEIVPRSSIIKSGFMLANNTGIIDPTYRGNLKIALLKMMILLFLIKYAKTAKQNMI